MRNSDSNGVLLRVQVGGRLTIPHLYLKSHGIEDGALILVKISKAIITAENEEEGE